MWWYWDLELDNRKTPNRSEDLLEDIGFYYDDDTESYSDEEYDKEDKSIKRVQDLNEIGGVERKWNGANRGNVGGKAEGKNEK